jgi:polysaccharide deacetylase 2 family uncharacterized protein YibQ
MKKIIGLTIVLLVIGLASYYGYDLYRVEQLKEKQAKEEEYKKKIKKELNALYGELEGYEISSIENNSKGYTQYTIRVENGMNIDLESDFFDIKKQENVLEIWKDDVHYTEIKINYYSPYRLAILIDDVGMNTSTAYKFIKINKPITFAILPFLPRTTEAADILRENSYKTILHMPMESLGSERLNANTEGLIRTSMTNEEIETKFNEALKDVGKVDGFNNHMGSKFTSNREKMEFLLEVAKEKNMYYIDSWTTRKSVGYKVAKEKKLPTYKSSVFLDNKKDVEYIKERIKVAVERTLEEKKLIAIGHYHPATAEAISEMVDYIAENNVELVYVNEMLE